MQKDRETKMIRIMASKTEVKMISDLGVGLPSEPAPSMLKI